MLDGRPLGRREKNATHRVMSSWVKRGSEILMGFGILLAGLGIAALLAGVFLLFNIRGVADSIARSRNETRAGIGARTMQMELLNESRFGACFFRIIGWVLSFGGLVLLLGGVVELVGS
jgi:hypothetical protein